MKSSPAVSASLASLRQSGQLADQRSGTLVAERPDEQLAPNKPILNALALYIAARCCIEAVWASTDASSGLFLGSKGKRKRGRRSRGLVCGEFRRELSQTLLRYYRFGPAAFAILPQRASASLMI